MTANRPSRVSSPAEITPMPHRRYKVEAVSIGEDGDWIVFGTHDPVEAAALIRPEKHGLECLWGADLSTCQDCTWLPSDGAPGWWRQRPGGPHDDYVWWLVRATGPGPGARPAVYFRG